MKRTLSPRVYLYRELVDFRKSINGLTTMIESELYESTPNSTFTVLAMNF